MEGNLNHSELLNLLAEGDNQAYRQLYSLYYVALKSLANYYIGDEDLAGDMVQDTFLSLLGYRRRFGSVNEVKYFLYASLKNKCISQLRKNKVRQKAEPVVQGLYDRMSDYWNRAMEEDVYSQLMAAIETLPPQCRLVMQLTLEGLKVTQIAERLGISPETVKEHRANGKKKIATWLRDNEMLAIIYFLLS